LFEPSDGNGTRQLTLVNGAVRVAAVDAKAGYTVRTPNASFKVHKSDQEAMFVPRDAPEADGGRHAGTFQKVHFGRGEMNTADEIVVLEPADVGFVPVDGNAAGATKLDRLPASVEKAYSNSLPTKLDKGKVGTAAREPGKSALPAQQPAADIAPLKAGGPLPMLNAVGASAASSAKARPATTPAQPHAMGAHDKLTPPVRAVAKPPAASAALQPALTLKPAASSGPAATSGTTEFQIVGNKAKPQKDNAKIAVPKKQK
jgi:hypothetical protein